MLAELLSIIGRKPSEHCTVLSQAPGEVGLHVDWTTVGQAELVAGKYAGARSVWYGVQPLDRPADGRGKRSDVTGLRCLYADLDDKNMDRVIALSIIGDLSDILAKEHHAIVVSGGGLQPYWAIEELDPLDGAVALAWWREQVIKVARAYGVSVDTGVYDLSRILRVPGPPNLKACYGPGGAKTGLIVGEKSGPITIAELDLAMQLYPVEKKTRSTFTRSEPGLIGPRGVSSEDRVFTAEQWASYIRRPGGELEVMGSTELGAGFNTALNKAAFACGAGVPELWSEAEAIDAILEYLEKQFPGGPDAQDWSTIKSGFSQTSWSARRPTEAEAVDPFRAFADPVAIWEKQGRKVQREKVGARGQKSTETGTQLPDADDPVFLSEEFWTARPVFAHLRRTAWSAMESPEGVLVAALALTIARVMPNVMLPAHVGVEASLNLMTVLAGASADGKSVCRKLADGALKFEGDTADVWRFNPSSGQGIAGQFQVLRKPKGEEPRMVRTRYRAIANVEESDTLAALAANPTSTLSSELRKGAMGEDLGFGNVGETQTNLKEHSYRLVLMMCLQPSLGAWLLGDEQGGLPQRFLWCSVRDPRIVEDIERPGLFPVRLPTEAMIDPISEVPRGRFIMSSTNAIRNDVLEAKRQRKVRGDESGPDFDGHSMLTRLKVAGALALLDGRLGINDEDWALSAAIMTMSTAARGIVQAAVASAAARNNEQTGRARGRARVFEEGVVTDTVKTRCRERVLKIVSDQPGILRRALHARLSTAQKETFSEVLDELLAEGLIRFEERPTSSAWYVV